MTESRRADVGSCDCLALRRRAAQRVEDRSNPPAADMSRCLKLVKFALGTPQRVQYHRGFGTVRRISSGTLSGGKEELCEQRSSRIIKKCRGMKDMRTMINLILHLILTLLLISTDGPHWHSWLLISSGPVI